jgi:hypothetical protein
MEDVLEVYTRPYDPLRPQICMDETSKQPWNATDTRRKIVDFVTSVTQEGSPNYLPPEQRVAVFDDQRLHSRSCPHDHSRSAT